MIKTDIVNKSLIIEFDGICFRYTRYEVVKHIYDKLLDVLLAYNGNNILVTTIDLGFSRCITYKLVISHYSNNELISSLIGRSLTDGKSVINNPDLNIDDIEEIMYSCYEYLELLSTEIIELVE